MFLFCPSEVWCCDAFYSTIFFQPPIFPSTHPTRYAHDTIPSLLVNSAVRGAPFDFQGGAWKLGLGKKNCTPQMDEVFFFFLVSLMGEVFFFKNYHFATGFRGWVEFFFCFAALSSEVFFFFFTPQVSEGFLFSLNSGWRFFFFLFKKLPWPPQYQMVHP